MASGLNEVEKFLINNYQKYSELCEIDKGLGARLYAMIGEIDEQLRGQDWWRKDFESYIGNDYLCIYNPCWSSRKKNIDDKDEVAGFWFSNFSVESILSNENSKRPFLSLWIEPFGDEQVVANRKRILSIKFVAGDRKFKNDSETAFWYYPHPSLDLNKIFENTDSFYDFIISEFSFMVTHFGDQLDKIAKESKKQSF